jgi:hypothetical protein
MIPEWPPELPRPMRDSYQQTAGEARLMKKNDSGPPGTRRRFSSVADTVSMTVDLSRNQLARFDRFYNEEVAQGSKPFRIMDASLSGQRLLTDEEVPILTDDGHPILIEETWLVLFGQQLPSRSVIGVRWRVSFQLSVMPV